MKTRNYEISGNRIVLFCVVFLCPIPGGSSNVTQILDFPLTSMSGFREGESHAPNLKPTLVLIGTT